MEEQFVNQSLSRVSRISLFQRIEGQQVGPSDS